VPPSAPAISKFLRLRGMTQIVARIKAAARQAAAAGTTGPAVAGLIDAALRASKRRPAALDAVGLAGRASHLPSELSGGQQQRVAIARALVKEPKVVLAGEDTRDDIIGLLENLWRERGLTLVMVTHDTSTARRAQRVGVMSNGHLTTRQSATPPA
jgi:putative ABC transport system ATP-binding protein